DPDGPLGPVEGAALGTGLHRSPDGGAALPAGAGHLDQPKEKGTTETQRDRNLSMFVMPGAADLPKRSRSGFASAKAGGRARASTPSDDLMIQIIPSGICPHY